MGKTDSLSKQYAEDNERFCELINAGVFHGRKVLIPENLKTVNTQEYTIDLKTETARQRDILKHCVIKTDGKTTFLLIGLENTSYIVKWIACQGQKYDRKEIQGNAYALPCIFALRPCRSGCFYCV